MKRYRSGNRTPNVGAARISAIEANSFERAHMAGGAGVGMGRQVRVLADEDDAGSGGARNASVQSGWRADQSTRTKSRSGGRSTGESTRTRVASAAEAADSMRL